jgi:cation transport regulator ChaB
MKTAMQELIDEIKEAVPYFKMGIYQENFNKALEKEKEQIIDAWKDNRDLIYYDNDKDELSENTSMELGEEYYNQTYNQNK